MKKIFTTLLASTLLFTACNSEDATEEEQQTQKENTVLNDLTIEGLKGNIKTIHKSTYTSFGQNINDEWVPKNPAEGGNTYETYNRDGYKTLDVYVKNNGDKATKYVVYGIDGHTKTLLTYGGGEMLSIKKINYEGNTMEYKIYQTTATDTMLNGSIKRIYKEDGRSFVSQFIMNGKEDSPTAFDLTIAEHTETTTIKAEGTTKTITKNILARDEKGNPTKIRAIHTGDRDLEYLDVFEYTYYE